MRTIEQASSEYVTDLKYEEAVESLAKGISIKTILQIYTTMAFEAGVKFAQEWISVENGLPESGITVLIKDKRNCIDWACIRYGDWDHKFKNTITHWRPITKK